MRGSGDRGGGCRSLGRRRIDGGGGLGGRPRGFWWEWSSSGDGVLSFPLSFGQGGHGGEKGFNLLGFSVACDGLDLPGHLIKQDFC